MIVHGALTLAADVGVKAGGVVNTTAFSGIVVFECTSVTPVENSRLLNSMASQEAQSARHMT